MKFTLIVFLALAMMACLSNAWMDPKGPCILTDECTQALCSVGYPGCQKRKQCKITADCGKDHECQSGFCYKVEAPANLDTLFDQ
ncbi:unnamed protein product [Caenorhabditis nigoni]